MKPITRNAALVLIPVVMLAACGCMNKGMNGIEEADVADSVAAEVEVMVSPDGVSCMVVSTMNVTGVVTSVNARKHKVTFALEDGSSKAVKVDKKLDLALVPVGEAVTVQVG